MGITTFTLSARNFDLWMHQNCGDYTGEFLEGTLLDNFVVVTKNGIEAFYERALNEWTSCYYVEFGRFGSGVSDRVLARWYDWYDSQDMDGE